MPAPRRILRPLLTSLTLGLLTSITLTWLATILAAGKQPTALTTEYIEAPTWPYPAPDSWPQPTQLIRRTAWAFTSEDASTFSDVSFGLAILTADTGNSLVLRQAGWPFKALASETLWRPAPPTPNAPPTARLLPQAPEHHHALFSPALLHARTGTGTPIILPCRPLPGLLLNTLLFSAAAAIPTQLLTHICRALRHRRGRCARCGYSLADLPPGPANTRTCPECGQAAHFPHRR